MEGERESETERICWVCSLGMHGPLKLRTVHLSDNTKIYESEVSVQNVFP
jgi:hypothetical protein